ncbi:hypothetical protein ADU59_02430 [Pararhizobium polonicum]|uniref:Uncharacterized protein n=1 Tax=Pararhizobium polonicum TaxID=1612624 RepID=A0A1C7P5W0_9HYPH|nr:hypothetical protein [Pararhizobium polonicum]OBZ96630.1 hypothetical protein ADU59_02430 [Pararhizobium polonicum]
MQDENDQTGKEAAAHAASGRLEPGGEAARQAEARRERAAKTLRDNLLRRKQQGRARRAGAADETSGLPAAKTDESAE